MCEFRAWADRVAEKSDWELSWALMLLPHPPPVALGGDIAGTKESLWVSVHRAVAYLSLAVFLLASALFL